MNLARQELLNMSLKKTNVKGNKKERMRSELQKKQRNNVIKKRES